MSYAEDMGYDGYFPEDFDKKDDKSSFMGSRSKASVTLGDSKKLVTLLDEIEGLMEGLIEGDIATNDIDDVQDIIYQGIKDIRNLLSLT